MQIAPILALALVRIMSPASDAGEPITESRMPAAESRGPAVESRMSKIESCLSSREMREEIAGHRVVQPLVALKAAGFGEKIRAQLCKTEKGLVYLITALGRDGHVSRIFVDASSGLRLDER